jgi:hypothetical protein
MDRYDVRLFAPYTMRRMVPLPRFAGEEPAPPLLILPRLRGRGTAEGGEGGNAQPHVLMEACHG